MNGTWQYVNLSLCPKLLDHCTLITFAPEVVILDIDMPSMDGFELAAAVRNTHGMEKVTLFALSGWNDHTVRDRCSAAGFDHFFAKPTPVSEILLALSGNEK